jgi:hypothetical protein
VYWNIDVITLKYYTGEYKKSNKKKPNPGGNKTV